MLAIPLSVLVSYQPDPEPLHWEDLLATDRPDSRFCQWLCQ